MLTWVGKNGLLIVLYSDGYVNQRAGVQIPSVKETRKNRNTTQTDRQTERNADIEFNRQTKMLTGLALK